MSLLLAQDDVNPDMSDNDGETPLWRASYNGHDGVVSLLLVRSVLNRPGAPQGRRGKR